MSKNKIYLTLTVALPLLLSSCFSSTIYAPKSLIGKTLQLLVTKTVNYTDASSNKGLTYKFSKTNRYMVYFDGKLTQTGYFSYRRKKSNKVRIICTHQNKNSPVSYEIILVFQDEQSGTWECPYNKGLTGAHAGDFILE